MNLKKNFNLLLCFFILTITTQAAEKNEQRVEASVSVKSSSEGAMILSLTKEKLCNTYSMQLFTADIATRISDGILAQYFNNQKIKKDTLELKNVKLIDLGFCVLPEKEYTMLTLAYDKNGNPGLVTRTTFTTPKRKPVGNPRLSCTITKVGPDCVTVKFKPNAHVAGYAICQFEAGSIDSLVTNHGPMMGFSNASDMIRRFSSKAYTKEKSYTWDGMIPNYDYEICALPWDKNGVYLDIVTTRVKTALLGGKGEATVNIEIGEFGGSKDTGFYQEVIYTPNDQAAVHRDLIITEEAYNSHEIGGDEGIIKMLKEEKAQDPYWNQYRVDRAKWNAEPNTAYVACSIARNVKGEWGKLQKKKFKTPENK